MYPYTRAPPPDHFSRYTNRLNPGVGDYFGKVVRVDLATFSQVQVLDLTATDPDLKGFYGGFASAGYGYFVPYRNKNDNDGSSDYFGKVVRVDLTTFSQVQVLDLTATDPDLKGFFGGFASGGYGYFVPYYNGNFFGKVVRVDLATFSQVQVLDLTTTDPDLTGFWGGFASGDYGYLVPHNNNGGRSGKVARVDLATFSQAQVLDLTATDPHLKGFWGGFASDDYGYFVPFNNYNGTGVAGDAYFGKVVRIELAQGLLTLTFFSAMTISTCVLFLTLPSLTRSHV